MSDEPDHHRRGLLARLRANFLTGLVVLLPISLTVYLIWSVTGWIDSWVLPFIPSPYRPEVLLRHVFGPGAAVTIRGLGVLIFLVFTVVIGWLAKGLIGRTLIRRAERLVDRMPVVRSIYNGLKQIAETVFAQSEKSFERACLVEYPRRGIWGIGFVSTAAKGEIASRVPSEEQILSVFLPTTPNPTSGFLLYVPASEVIILDMTVEDAAKLIISAGLVYPSPKAVDAAAKALKAKA
ncbi:MAG: DUF502 domain-containing protein [Paracoccaceae bacterium]|nr:DUF502 domain-containing protein [Paracoccaceae bacterium]MDE3239408.1 DUF502 domain-containing protein [Paracoccaceae bacterium]